MTSIDQLPPAILLVGPTASGKTALALDIAARYNGEIISVDSALVFRDMTIGTAKPDAATLAQFPHHLIDLISPEERYSAARFCVDALAAMADITRRGKLPLLVGGTLLYVKALREGLADLPVADPDIRSAIEAEANQHGWPMVHAELFRCDPITAGRLAPNDSQRIQRALEVFRLTGKPLSEWLADGIAGDSKASNPLPYALLPLGLQPTERSELHLRIAQRFDYMLDAGLVNELERLQQKYRLDENLPSMRCVGYRQAWQHLRGDFDRAELRDRGIYATRQLAKRQLTWMRSMPDLKTIDCLAPSLLSKIAPFIDQHLDRHRPVTT
jgi:tRNA dimethylallyltransferase